MQTFDSAMQNQVYRFLASWAADVKAAAMRNALVRTGRMRSSIYAVVSYWVVSIGVGATYGLFVELGTRYMLAHPFLWPALQEYLPELEFNIIGAINQAKAEAGLS